MTFTLNCAEPPHRVVFFDFVGMFVLEAAADGVKFPGHAGNEIFDKWNDWRLSIFTVPKNTLYVLSQLGEIVTVLI